MRIEHVDIRNFRKLKSCRVELSSKETIFVGANNSGKTSAMDALMFFLKRSKQKDIRTIDFTLSNWSAINGIGESWVESTDEGDLDLAISMWRPYMPSIDVWLQVEDEEIHYVSHLIPTLDWSGGLLGVRLILEPKDTEKLYKAYKAAFESAKTTTESRSSSSQDDSGGNGKTRLNLWPQSMRDFLDRELHRYFAIHAYIRDPSRRDDEKSQDLPAESEPIEGDPFDGLIKIDIINAQRGFSDPNSDGDSSKNDRRLSVQLQRYYRDHLDPTELPDGNDLNALEAMEVARTAFNARLKESFHPAITELEGLNYPGFGGNPRITLSSKVNPVEGLNHDAAVQFDMARDSESSNAESLWLPEKYNGLGYQNLISMVFKLIRFRDEWMRVGKAGKKVAEKDSFIEPLHLVLIEEPEAHLHAQVQQVFIRKAYDVLRNHDHLKDKAQAQFHTQLAVSTHSNHIAHEIDFTCLRYFKRIPAINGDVPSATVVNLSTTFGDGKNGSKDDDAKKTSKFATRYLKTTHCDLFFADAAILVEGPAERMLIPHFIRSNYPDLDKSYLSILEIGGSHAHRLRPLIEALGLLTLVVTDLDSIDTDSKKKVCPKKDEKYQTGNNTLKQWAPRLEKLDEVLDASAEKKEASDGTVRIAYQCAIKVAWNDKEEEAIPYTFEDALVLANIDFFKEKNEETAGLIKKMAEAVSKQTLDEAYQEMFKALESGKKAEMALEILYITEPNQLEPPKYIKEGLDWLDAKLRPQFDDDIGRNPGTGGEA